MHSFLYGLFGGALIGLAAAILLLCNGDILGASGIASSIGLHPLAALRDATQHWKIVLIANFFVTSNLFFASDYQDLDQGLASLSVYAYLLGGFLVGFGTKLGNGCTSGHGICGLARFSKRSIVSVCTFMTIGIVTAVLTQQATTPFPENAFDFLRTDEPDKNPIAMWSKVAAVLVFVWALLAIVAPSFHNVTLESFSNNSRLKLAAAAVAGVLFASGLYLSRMVYPTVVLGFLNFALMPLGEWDATLAFVMGGGLLISATAYQVVDGYTLELLKKCCTSRRLPLTKPIALQQEEGNDKMFCIPTSQIIDCDLVVGAVLFGLGWGICGLCPGPAMFLAAIGVSWVIVCYWPAFYLGSFLATKVKECRQNATERPPDLSDDATQVEENNGHSNNNIKQKSPRSQTSNESNPLAIMLSPVDENHQ